MKKKIKLKTTFKQAQADYKKYYGTEPSYFVIFEIYDWYGMNWKKYKDFLDYLADDSVNKYWR